MEGYGMDKLSSEIFSILESKFLFGDKNNNKTSCRVRVLSIDAGGSTDGLLAATSLARLEATFQRLTANPSARLADFFDLAAGSGIGGVLVSLLFSRGSNNRPLLSASEALRFLSKNHRLLAVQNKKKSSFLRQLFRRRKTSGGSIFREIFRDLSLRDTVKPVLIPCYDLSTGAPLVFSRADAVETDDYDFRLRDVCCATMGMAAADDVRSVNGRTRIDAASLDSGVATGNPTSAAVTHVLNNKSEFPLVRGVEDLVVVSLGNGECGGGINKRQSGYATPCVKIAGDGVADMIDQAVGMAFGDRREANYVRIQARGELGDYDSLAVEKMLNQRNVESVMFVGKKVSPRTNADRLDWVARELVTEDIKRKDFPQSHPVVLITPSSSSSSTSSPTTSLSLTSSP